jgi:diguanylate cyclase (GGDEF)-like protein
LTALHNRRGFLTLADQQVKLANRTKQRLLLLMADLDHLKLINDTFGHQEGDLVLIEIARVLKETFRGSDILARLGGDEFAMLLVGCDEAEGKRIMTRLQANLEAHNARSDRPYKVTLSVGMACYDPDHPCSIDDLIAQADSSMYEQKRGGPR